jgi:outer membrane protein assembly factor BamB
MRPAIYMMFFLVLLILSGCGTKNRLDREMALFEVNQPEGEIGLRAHRSTGYKYTGRLDLLYEKKTKGSADSPIITGNGVIAFKTTRERFLAFDQKTGNKIVQIKKRRGIALNPVIKDSLLILVRSSTYGEIHVISLASGKILKERVIGEVRSGPIVVSNNIIFGTIGGLLALTLPGLDTEWMIETESVIDVAAVYGRGIMYYTDGFGVVRAFRTDDGEEIWHADYGSAIVSELSLGDHLYAAVADGRIMAIDKESGTIVWDYPFEYQIRGGVAEYDNRVYFGCTDGNVYCLSADEGKLLWRFSTEGIVTASPVIYDRAVLIGSHDRRFYTIDRISGELIERRDLDGPVTLAAAVDNGKIFVTCRGQRLYCFREKPLIDFTK